MELRQLRERSGLSREEISEATGVNRTTLYRIEMAQAKPQLRTLRVLLDIYSVPESRQHELITMLRLAKEETWLEVASDLPPQYATYIGLEHGAKAILNYETLFVPGLLQTEAYARTAIPGGLTDLHPEEVEKRVKARLARQARVPALPIYAIIDEAVLRRSIGGPAVMREQLQRLIDESKQPHVTLQVIPFTAGIHPGMYGSFVILQFPQDVRDVVYIETRTADLFLDGENSLQEYNVVFERLREIAASPAETRDTMAHMLADIK
ncbi:helix-turn-helix transcriptional regulator [Nonomuraea sp. NPDC049750]|uniref:helix-turn-helix domain-containing protein n=1 Tax=Nonomuraea sp. NPDC049750 TaxID=3154738 RepID=UPI0033CD6104